MLKNLTLIAAVLAAAACAPDVPAEPTWTEDVKPIVVGNCIRCHTPPQIELAPSSVRLDKYDGENRDGLPFDADGQTPGIQDVGEDGIDDFCPVSIRDMCGAGTPLHDGGSIGLTMANYVSLPLENALHMPPEFELWSRQIETIQAWAENGSPKGPPLPGNRAPTIELLGDFRAEGDLLVATYQIDDADDDLVTGRLVAEAGGEELVVTWELFSGRGQIEWDLNPQNQDDVPSGTYRLTAVISDESEEVSLDLGTVDVP